MSETSDAYQKGYEHGLEAGVAENATAKQIINNLLTHMDSWEFGECDATREAYEFLRGELEEVEGGSWMWERMHALKVENKRLRKGLADAKCGLRQRDTATVEFPNGCAHGCSEPYCDAIKREG